MISSSVGAGAVLSREEGIGPGEDKAGFADI